MAHFSFGISVKSGAKIPPKITILCVCILSNDNYKSEVKRAGFPSALVLHVQVSETEPSMERIIQIAEDGLIPDHDGSASFFCRMHGVVRGWHPGLPVRVHLPCRRARVPCPSPRWRGVPWRMPPSRQRGFPSQSARWSSGQAPTARQSAGRGCFGAGEPV